MPKIKAKNLTIKKGEIIPGIIAGLDTEALKLFIEESSAADDKLEAAMGRLRHRSWSFTMDEVKADD